MGRKHLRTTACATAAAGIGLLVLPALGSTADAAATTTMGGSQPSWAIGGHVVATPAASAGRTFEVNLPLRPGAAAFAAAVSDPSSASYGRYLTPAQYDARFAPTPAQVRSVEGWLRGAGFHVVSVPSNSRYVEVTGTYAQIDRAFSTTMRTYAVDGLDLVAPSTALRVPSSVAADVLAVTGLDDSDLLTRPDHAALGAGGATSASAAATTSTSLPACSSYWDQHRGTVPKAYGHTTYPTYVCGYEARQLESAYGMSTAIASGRDGAGVTVAITDAYASSTIVGDVDAFSKADGIAPLAPGQLVQSLPASFDHQAACGGAPGWKIEETIDVEAVHTMAPGAHIVYVGAENCGNALAITATNSVVSQHLADIVTDSWSDGGEVPASDAQASDAIFEQGAAEGIGFNFSSGDSGDDLAATGKTQPSFPGSSPYVTAVGGTTLAVSRSGSYEFETAWGNEQDQAATATTYALPLPGYFYAGGGGGTSHVFAEPSYQEGVVPTSLSDEYGSPARVVPDVSALADPFTGLELYITTDGTLGTVTYGGTSLASPLFAGMEADAADGRSAAIGFANPLLYSKATSGAFHDVTSTVDPVALDFDLSASKTFLVTEGLDTSLQATAGYDDATGLGTPDGGAFLSAIG